MGQTALHMAVHQGHARIVERLVGYGIDLNLRDSDGDTALHIALARQTIDVLSSETPQLNKVRCGLRLVMIMGCFQTSTYKTSPYSLCTPKHVFSAALEP